MALLVGGESVVEELCAKKTRAAVAPAASSSSVPRKKVHRSPKEILQPLSPPGCTLALAFNDYRFTASWKRHIRCDFWIDELSNFSFSSVFTKILERKPSYCSCAFMGKMEHSKGCCTRTDIARRTPKTESWCHCGLGVR